MEGGRSKKDHGISFPVEYVDSFSHIGYNRAYKIRLLNEFWVGQNWRGR